MRRLVLIGVLAVFMLGVAAPALAKGASSATIEGPGIAIAILIEDGNLAQLVEASGFWQLLYGTENPSNTGGRILSHAPEGEHGPRYVVTWYLGDEPYPAQFDVYPLAVAGPLVHVAEGTVGGYFGIDTVPGGWFAADPILTELLVGYGVSMSIAKPASTPDVSSPAAPDAGSQRSRMAVAAAIGTGVVLAAGGVWAMGRRPRRLRAP